MIHSSRTSRKCTDPRPAYLPLGVDTAGAFHVCRTTDETIHVVEDGTRSHRFDLGAHSVDDYVRFVRDEVDGRDWATRRYTLAEEDTWARVAERLAAGLEQTA